MEAGKLDRRITLETSTTTRSKSGQSKSGWVTLATVWAAKKSIAGSRTTLESFQAGQLTAEVPVIFTIRYRNDINAKNRINEDGRIYNIISISEIGRRKGLDIIAIGEDNGSVIAPAPVPALSNVTATPVSASEIEVSWQIS